MGRGRGLDGNCNPGCRRLRGLPDTPATDSALYNPGLNTWSTPASTGGCGGRTILLAAEPYVVALGENGWCRFDTRTQQWSAVAPRPAGRTLPEPVSGITVSTGAEILTYGDTGRTEGAGPTCALRRAGFDLANASYDPQTKEIRFAIDAAVTAAVSGQFSFQISRGGR